MSITIDALTIDDARAWQSSQPYGFEQTDVREGMVARQWTINGFFTPAQYVSLLQLYDTWRTARISEEPTETSMVAGTTVAFSGTGPGGIQWTNIACWFTDAPLADQAGAYLNVSFSLVDAVEALAVQAKQALTGESGSGSSGDPDLGTINIGGVVLNLKKPFESYGAGPQLELTATGSHYLTGPLVVEKIKDVEGTFDIVTYPSGWATIQSWYEAQIIAVPVPGSDFPISPPTATAERKISSGVMTTVYTISLQLGVVL